MPPSLLSRSPTPAPTPPTPAPTPPRYVGVHNPLKNPDSTTVSAADPKIKDVALLQAAAPINTFQNWLFAAPLIDQGRKDVVREEVKADFRADDPKQRAAAPAASAVLTAAIPEYLVKISEAIDMGEFGNPYNIKYEPITQWAKPAVVPIVESNDEKKPLLSLQVQVPITLPVLAAASKKEHSILPQHAVQINTSTVGPVVHSPSALAASSEDLAVQIAAPLIDQGRKDVVREEVKADFHADNPKQQAAAPILTAKESLNAAVPSTELLDTSVNHAILNARKSFHNKRISPVVIFTPLPDLTFFSVSLYISSPPS
jgi:hypothetical protein